MARVCSQCGTENPLERDFCACGNYLRWEMTGEMKVVAAPPPVEVAGAAERSAVAPPPVAVPPVAEPPVAVASPVGAPPAVPPSSPAPSPPPPVHDLSPVAAIVITPDALTVEPGQRAQCVAQVRNAGAIVDNFGLHIQGIPDSWYTIAPDTVHLLPFGSAGTYETDVQIHFHPPRTADAHARRWDLQLLASSGALQAQVAAIPLALTILPYVEFEARAKPERASGRRRANYEVAVVNRANAPATVALGLGDPEDEVTHSYRQPEVELAAGETVTSRLQVRAPKLIWIGRPVERRLNVLAGDLRPLPIVFRQKPLLPWWTPLLLGLLLLIGLLLFLLVPRKATVPDLRGRTTLEAQQLLAQSELVLDSNFKRVVRRSVKPGTIVGQGPLPGDKVAKGTPVGVEIAVGSDRVKVPKVTGLTVAKADSRLRKSGLSLGAQQPQPVDLEAQIETQIPEAGERVREGTPVNVFLAGAEADPDDPAGTGADGGGDDGDAETDDDTAVATRKVSELAFDDGRDLQIAGAKDRITAVAAGVEVEKDPTWSPDGRRLAYVSGRRLIVRDADGTAAQVGADDQGDLEDPSWAPDPDSDLLAISRVRGDDRDLCLGRLDGSLTLSCLPDDGTVLVESARWHPDGKTLLVPGFDRESGNQGILRFTSSVAFSSRSDDWRPEGIVTDTSLMSAGRYVQDAAFSPDGERLAVVANIDADVPTVYVTAADDLALANATSLRVPGCKVAWRPDGKEIAVAQSDQCNERGVPAGELVRVSPDRPGALTSVAAAGDNPAYRPSAR